MDQTKRFWNERRLKLKAELEAKRLPGAVCLPESKHIENVGGIIRSANAFLIKEVVLDQKVFNKAASAGTSHWENITIKDDIWEYIKEQGYVTVALEQHPRSVKLWDFKFPAKMILIAGHEVRGMSDSQIDSCEHVIEIPQYGIVESLNVASAVSIALYEYTRQHQDLRSGK
ncbi:MAG: TrmH family RNA methyltransferase [Candidatus Caenarcaniphilales bacterium]|nr:TrmH family RNA methyltransferase [Candidatus Caenarcaniphilales bacterium]